MLIVLVSSPCILKFFLQHRSHLLLLLLPACVQLSSVDNNYAVFFANGELNESVFIWLTWTSRSFFKSSSYQAIGNLYYQKSNFAPLPSSDLTVGLSERVRGGGAPGPVCARFCNVLCCVVKLMKMFSYFACVLTTCMCFLKLLCVELSGPPYIRHILHCSDWL